MSITITIIDNNPDDTDWLISCLRVSPLAISCNVFFNLDQLQRDAPDVILVAEGMLDFFQEHREISEYQAIREIPYILLADWGKADVDIEESDAVDGLPKSFITPHLLTFAIRYAVKNAQNERELRQLAHYDQLTQAANRHLFLDRLSQALLHAKRNDQKFGLVMLDLDEFKPVNDTYGHDAGDYLLKNLVKRIKKSVRESDTIARLGGDEFALLLPKIETTEQLEAIVEKLFTTIKNHWFGKHTNWKSKPQRVLPCYP